MVRFAGYAKKREPRWPYVGLAFIILMAAAVVLFIFSAVTQWLEAEASKPVPTTTLVPATTTTSLAPAKTTSIPVPAAATGIKIERIVIASGVDGANPVDDLTKVPASEFSQLYCYVKMSNAGNSQAIRHVWIGPDGKVAAQIDLTARGGASATWSYINVSGLGAGQWQVRVETKAGAVLARKAFVTY
jgi:hypothetical protein